MCLVRGEWYGKKDTILAYNDENKNYKPLPFTFSRDSTGTIVNKDGLIETVGIDEPRVDYLDNSDGHLLLEPSRTNLLPYSNDFTNGAYSKTRCTVTSNQAISPDGTQNADLMTATGDDARLEDAVGTAGQSTTMSLYVKSATGSDVDGQIDFSGANTVTFTATNEWQRIDTTLTTLTINPRLRVRITNDGDSLYVFGGQVEYGSYATSYIPTNGSSVTRAADSCSGAGNSEVFNDSEGVLYAEIAALTDDNTSRRISISDGSSNPNNLVSIDISEYTDTIVGRIRTSDSEVAFLTKASQNQTQNNKIAVKYKVNDFALWINGVEVATDNNGAIPIGLDEISFDRGNGTSNYFYGKIKDLKVYNTALTDAELITLTT